MIRCPSCDAPTRATFEISVPGQPAIERRRRCTNCGELVITFEVVAGTEITWQAEDDAPVLRSKEYKPRAAKASYRRAAR